MVGLPARGKSFIARKLARYLNWLQVKSRVFNVGNYRRNKLGAHQPHTFFDPLNISGMKSRRHMAVAALDDMIEWLHVNGRVGVFDATNTTRERRRMLLARLRHENVDVMFVESICTKQVLIESNIHATKLTSPE
jgi:predicted kinase